MIYLAGLERAERDPYEFTPKIEGVRTFKKLLTLNLAALQSVYPNKVSPCLILVFKDFYVRF